MLREDATWPGQVRRPAIAVTHTDQSLRDYGLRLTFLAHSLGVRNHSWRYLQMIYSRMPTVCRYAYGSFLSWVSVTCGSRRFSPRKYEAETLILYYFIVCHSWWLPQAVVMTSLWGLWSITLCRRVLHHAGWAPIDGTQPAWCLENDLQGISRGALSLSSWTGRQGCNLRSVDGSME